MENQHNAFLKIICFFWLIAKIISMKAWLSERLMPVVPAFEFTESFPAWVHSFLFYASLSAIIAVFIFPKKKILLITLFIIEICTCLLDVIRWQPWEYQYLFMLLVFIIHRQRPQQLITALLFIMASVYIFSGIHKFNGGFLYTVWEQMILKRFFGLSSVFIKESNLHYVGLLLPVYEAAMGFGLLLLKNKKWPALLLIAMHLFILVLLSPFGLNYNIVVWPWNAAMILLLYWLYVKNDFKLSFRPLWQGYNKGILLFWGLLPILSFFGYWGKFMSSGVYSGTTLNVAICVPDKKEIKALEPYFSKLDQHNLCGGKNYLSVQNWCLAEIKLPPYPEPWYYSRLKKKLAQKYPYTNVDFVLYCYPYKDLTKME